MAARRSPGQVRERLAGPQRWTGAAVRRQGRDRLDGERRVPATDDGADGDRHVRGFKCRRRVGVVLSGLVADRGGNLPRVRRRELGAGLVLRRRDDRGIRSKSCLLYTSPSPRD